jgi:hypothetical protein
MVDQSQDRSEREITIAATASSPRVAQVCIFGSSSRSLVVVGVLMPPRPL